MLITFFSGGRKKRKRTPSPMGQNACVPKRRSEKRHCGEITKIRCDGLKFTTRLAVRLDGMNPNSCATGRAGEKGSTTSTLQQSGQPKKKGPAW